MALITTPVAGNVIGCAIRVHRELGPGLFESIYERCLAHELSKAGLVFRRQVPFPVRYDGLEFGRAFRADLIVADEVLVEVKTVDRLLPVHCKQVLTYLRCSRLKKGLLLNFSAPRLEIQSVVL